MRAMKIEQEGDIHRVLVDALKLARVELLLRDDALTADLLAARRDVTLERLDLDSLAAMEVCIAIELRLNVEIVPDHLHKKKSLNQLVDAVRRRM